MIHRTRPRCKRSSKFIRGTGFGIAAVLLGAGGLAGSSSAVVSSGERTVYVPITPCRLFDTRPAGDNVGLRATPLSSNETFVATVQGTNGKCTIPTGAISAALNVTVTNPTAASYLTVFPSDKPLPLASSLNWVSGQPPTPNAVTTDLSPDGKASFYNHSGTVDVIVDIVGYYEDHNFDDRYYTKDQTYSKGETYAKTEVDTSSRVDAKIAAAIVPPQFSEVEISAGLFVPAVLTVQFLFAGLAEPITTTTSGHWLITKYFSGFVTCASGAAFYFITVDGVAVRSSTVTRANSASNLVLDTMTGVTPNVMAAGTHSVAIGAQCSVTTSTPGNSGTLANTVASVTVLP